MDSVYLVGAETVQQAGSSINSAAHEMTRAANIFSEAVDRLLRGMEEHARRIESAMETAAGGGV